MSLEEGYIGPRPDVEPMPEMSLQPIPQEIVLQTIGFDGGDIPQEVIESVEKGRWLTSEDGRILVEVRHPDKLEASKSGMLYVSDLDDTLLGATGWHKEEYRRVSESPELHARGINITFEQAKELYEHSKLTLPGINEPRYTPEVNLVLASILARSLEKGEPPEQAWEATLRAFNMIKDDMANNGEGALKKYDLDKDVVGCLIDNHTADFVYDDLVEDLLEGTEPDDIRAIATRGKVEGAFGQIYKVHTTEILDKGQGMDIVVYTNDLKADALPIFYQLFKEAARNGTRIYDDNPKEIDKYLPWAMKHGVKNLEVIGVRHPDAKRKDFKVENEPVLSTGEVLETVYDLYYASEDVPQRDLVVGRRISENG